MNRLKIVAIVYLVKTLLVGIAWLVMPDLPQRAMTMARETWSSVSGRSAEPAAESGKR
jgi:hypothetical protein